MCVQALYDIPVFPIDMDNMDENGSERIRCRKLYELGPVSEQKPTF